MAAKTILFSCLLVVLSRKGADASLTPTPTSPALTPTCSALQQLAKNSTICETVGGDDCTRVVCTKQISLLSVVANMTVLPCNMPPGIRLVVKSGSTTLLDQIFVDSENISSPAGFLNVRLDRMEGSLGFKLVIAPIFGPAITLVDYTVIPIDTNGCMGSSVTTSSVSPTPTQVFPTTMVTPTPVPFTPTCSALRQLAEDQKDYDCTAIGGQDCSTVVCKADLEDVPSSIVSNMTVLPCNKPPGVALVVKLGELPIVDEVFVDSKHVSLFGMGSLNVTLDQLKDGIGFQLALSANDGPELTLIEYTVIPIDDGKCSGLAPSPTPTSDSDNNEGNSATANVLMMSSVTMAILVPFLV